MKKLVYTVLFILLISISSSQIFAQCGMKIARKYTNIKNPLIGEKEAAINGKVVFTNNCVICHGASGNGDGELSKSLNRKPANLVSNSFQQQKDSEIYWKITKGIGMMASFEDALTDTQRWELVNYIRTLKK